MNTMDRASSILRTLDKIEDHPVYRALNEGFFKLTGEVLEELDQIERHPIYGEIGQLEERLQNALELLGQLTTNGKENRS